MSNEKRIRFKRYFDKYFPTEEVIWPHNSKRVTITDCMPVRKNLKTFRKCLKRHDISADMVIDTSIFGNLATGIFINYNHDDCVYYRKNFEDMVQIRCRDLKSVSYDDRSHVISIDGEDIEIIEKSSRPWAKKLAECLQAYIRQDSL